MSAGSDLLEVTEETFSLIKAQTSGLFVSTGIQGVDLSGLVSLVPVETPFRNSTPRTRPPMGAQVASWRALLNVNSAQPNPAPGNDYAGPLTVVSEQDVFAPFIPLRLTGRVTQDAVDVSMNYADALAVETMQVLNQLMIGEDKYGINGLAYALPTIATPTATSATTGGTIASGTTINCKVAARSGVNYFYGGSGPASSQGSVTVGTTTSTNTATFKVTAVKGAVAYDWYFGGVYFTTTTVNTITLTASPPTTAQALPNLPLLSNVAPTTPPTADTSYSANSYNGLLASMLGDYGSNSLVTTGSGTASGAYFVSNDGSSLTFDGANCAELDALNTSLWNTAQISPTRYLVNAQQSTSVADKLLNSDAATTFLQPNEIGQRQNIVAGGAWGWYLNKATGGTPIKVETHPHVAPGTILAVSDRIPYPGANIDAPLSFRVQRDFSQFPYGANYNPNTLGGGPRTDFDVTVRETFVNKAPCTQGVICNVGA